MTDKYTNIDTNITNEGKVIYKDLSYQIVGILFEVYNNLGYGYKEKVYEEAIAKEFIKIKIKFTR